MTRGTGQLQSADGTISAALAETVPDLDVSGADSAAIRLAERYAKALDQASGMEASADRVLRAVERDGDEDLAEQVSALRQRVTAQGIVERVGPKLLDVLDSLGATPKGRARLPKQPTQGGGALAAVRSARGA
ncbi:MAG: terminase small subunit [Streptosporangiales bacterium]